MAPPAGVKPLILNLLALQAPSRRTAKAKIKLNGCPGMHVLFSKISLKDSSPQTAIFGQVFLNDCRQLGGERELQRMVPRQASI